jgi:hypothetical protein
MHDWISKEVFATYRRKRYRHGLPKCKIPVLVIKRKDQMPANRNKCPVSFENLTAIYHNMPLTYELY